MGRAPEVGKWDARERERARASWKEGRMEGGKEERERRKGRSKRGKKRGRGPRRKKEGREREGQDEQKAREESQKQTKRKERNIAEEKTEPDPLGVEALYRKSVGSPGDSSMTCRSRGSEWAKVACRFPCTFH